MARYAAAMDGTGPYEVVIYTATSGTTVTVWLYWQRVGSVGYSSYNGGATFNVTIGGVSVASGGYNFSAPAGGPIGEQFIGGGSYNVGAVGSTWCAGYFSTDTSGAGYGQVGGGQSVATVPAAPTNAAGTPDQVTATGMRYVFNGGSDGGSPIIRWEYEVWPSGGFPTGLGTSTGTTVRTDLTPNTTWNWHARGVNAIGAGPWSATVSRATLTALAPSLTVTPALSGATATLQGVPNTDPTQGMPTVDKWTVERRLQGTTTPVTTVEFTANPTTVSGLAPGSVYEWRVAATRNGQQSTYTSPFSAWQAVQQPNPNTTPGQFFDGDTPDTIDVDYGWSGVAGKSTSLARMPGLLGWQIAPDVSGATAVLARSSGGNSRTYAARMVVQSDSAAAGLMVQSTTAGRANVAELGVYYGSAFVRLPARSQRLAIRIGWVNAAGATIAQVTGTGDVVNAGGGWTRIILSAVTAPVGAVKAWLAVLDVAGTGWSAWLGGDVLMVDDAMIALGPYDYFDGATQDTIDAIYEWEGATDASASSRTPVAGTGVDPLEDPDCPSPPPAPRPPQIVDACIDDITSWRRYWAIVPKELISRWIAQVPTITLTSGALATRQARVRFYENPNQLPPDQFYDTTNWSSEQVVTYIPPSGVFTIDGVSQRARAQVGTSGALPADHLLLGSGGTPVSWPLLRCNMGYLMSVDVPLDAPSGNLQVAVSLTSRM